MACVGGGKEGISEGRERKEPTSHVYRMLSLTPSTSSVPQATPQGTVRLILLNATLQGPRSQISVFLAVERSVPVAAAGPVSLRLPTGV